MKLIKLLLAFCPLALVISAQPARAEVVFNDKSEINFAVYIPCANDGAGEIAVGSIRLHTLVSDTFDSAGGRHYGIHYQPMGASFVGLDTGDQYNGTGITKSSYNFNSGGLPFSDTYVNNFRLLGLGKAANSMLHTTTHLTVNELGEVTANVTNSSVTCK